MLKRVLLAAILCGLAASLLMSGAQHLRVVPLIAEAESFEGGGHSHDHGHSHDQTAAPETGHSHDHGAADNQATSPDLKRIGLTVTANAATGISFALILTAAALLLQLPITRENGLIWGFLGFTAFNLAPGATIDSKARSEIGNALLTNPDAQVAYCNDFGLFPNVDRCEFDLSRSDLKDVEPFRLLAGCLRGNRTLIASDGS